MTLSTKRQKEIAKALTLLVPGAPYIDAEAIRQTAAKPRYKALPPSTSVWLAAVAHIRHVHTDYDALLNEGYEREAARHFALGAVNDKLTEWRASRLLDASDEADRRTDLADEQELQ